MERVWKMKKQKLYKNLLILVIAVYVLLTLMNQQKALNQYDRTSSELTSQIEEEKGYKEELAKKKEDVTSLDFVEQMAREKLEMYYPNERVYMDRGM